MIKALGAVMVIISCSVTGLSVKRYLLNRKNSLKSFLSAFELIKSEIVFKNKDVVSITDLVCSYCSGTAVKFFEMVKAEEYRLMDCFNKNNAFLRKTGLTSEDISLIKDALFVIGRYDRILQSERLEDSVNRIEKTLSDLADEASSKGKIYTALGVTVGIMLVIILI